MKPTDLQSKVIAFIRFPLIVMVLFSHCNYRTISDEWANLAVASGVIDVISQRIAPIANPFFFFIAGYLFFKSGAFSINLYIKKLIRRFQSLFVPYMLWNLLYLIIVLVAGLFLANRPVIHKAVGDMAFTDWLMAFWNIGAINGDGSIKAPVAIQFWFIRDLMIVMLFSPLVYLLVNAFIKLGGKRPIVRWLFFLAIIFAFNYWPDIVGLNPDCWLFFGFGAYYSIKKKEFIVAMMPYMIPAAICLVLLIVLEQFWASDFLYRVEYVIGLVFGMSLTTNMVRSGTWYVNMTLSNASFFIFAYHSLLLGLLMPLFQSGLLKPYNDVLAIVYYLLTVTILVVVGLVLYKLMRKHLPFITYLLMGGRR